MTKSKFMSISVFLLTFLLVSGCTKVGDNPPRSRRPHIASEKPKSWTTPIKLVVIILENVDYELAVAQPFLSELSKKGALLTNYFAIVRTSQPNYIALTSGSTFGVNNDNVTLNARHLGDLLEERGKTWKNYAEGYPGNCFLEKSAGFYARKHVPFLSYLNIQSNPIRCAQVVNADQFSIDLKSGTLPDFSLYIPDNRNNGHDTGIAYADSWLSSFFKPILEDTNLVQNTTFVVTFDEVSVGSSKKDDRVATLFFGAGVKPGVTSTQDYDHFCLLRTIEDIFGLSTLGKHDQTADPIDDIWK